MMSRRSLNLAASLLFCFASADEVTFQPYVARIAALGGSSAAGIVVVATASGTDQLFYGGFLSGLEAELDPMTDCDATNGCGVHIHNGTSCDSTEAQGGHYFGESLSEDPWKMARYSSNADGNATISAWIDIGTKDVSGRAFMVHAQNGSRIGCGLLEPATGDDILLLRAHTMPVSNATAHGYVTVVAFPGTDQLCYMGFGESMEPDLESFLRGGSDCNATNGCGTHIHNGTGCANAEEQGGHWYDMTSGMTDPWKMLGYTSTDSAGAAWFGSCAHVGIDTEGSANKPFVLHSNAGSRVSCGLLTADGDEVSGQSDTTGSSNETSSNETSKPKPKPGGASSAVTIVNSMALLVASFIFIAQI